ncbi:MAG: hypothetical protein SF029_16495 [bacterium]|nr:hypothetical protein [bacterium]
MKEVGYSAAKYAGGNIMIDIDRNRYAKVGRGDVLALLEKAQVTPDTLIAHRNGTYTARYLRSRQFTPHDEAKIEAADRRVAIFKRPNERLDRGRYVTLTFALAETVKLGLPEVKAEAKPAPNGSNGHHTGHDSSSQNGAALPQIDTMMVLTMLQRVAMDMSQLINFADDLAKKTRTETPDSDQLVAALDELSDQITLFNMALKHLENAQK